MKERHAIMVPHAIVPRLLTPLIATQSVYNITKIPPTSRSNIVPRVSCKHYFIKLWNGPGSEHLILHIAAGKNYLHVDAMLRPMCMDAKNSSPISLSVSI